MTRVHRRAPRVQRVRAQIFLPAVHRSTMYRISVGGARQPAGATRAVQEVLCVPLYGRLSEAEVDRSVDMVAAIGEHARHQVAAGAANEAHLVRHPGLPQRTRGHLDLRADPAGLRIDLANYATSSSSSTTAPTTGRCAELAGDQGPGPERPGRLVHPNFGQMAAILAGLKQAAGDVVLQLSADLQDPIALMPQMVAEHERRLGGGRLPPRASGRPPPRRADLARPSIASCACRFRRFPPAGSTTSCSTAKWSTRSMRSTSATAFSRATFCGSATRRPSFRTRGPKRQSALAVHLRETAEELARCHPRLVVPADPVHFRSSAC